MVIFTQSPDGVSSFLGCGVRTGNYCFRARGSPVIDSPSSRSDRGRLAPSIQRAHRRVRLALVASGVHSAILVGIAVWLFLGAGVGEADLLAARVQGSVALAGAVVVPLLARAAWRGNSLAGLALFLTSISPPLVVLVAGGTPGLALLGLLVAPFYYLGARGAIGLRGRRGSRRNPR